MEIVKCVKGTKTVSGMWATAPELNLPWHTYWCKGFYSTGSGSDRVIDDMTSKDPKVAALEKRSLRVGVRPMRSGTVPCAQFWACAPDAQSAAILSGLRRYPFILKLRRRQTEGEHGTQVHRHYQRRRGLPHPV